MTAHAPSTRRVGLVRGLPALVALLLLPSASPAAVAIDASISSPLGPDVLVLTGFRGQEGLSRLFLYQLEMVSEESAIDAATLVGESMNLRIALADGSERHLNGVISRFARGAPIPGTSLTRYTAELRPWLWLLTQRRDIRIFQKMTAPEVIAEVFANLGMTDFDARLEREYVASECVVQYRETDFDFVSRLMEQEGIFYFFEHEAGKHTLVLGDAVGAYAGNGGGVTFDPSGRSSGAASDWNHGFEFRPGRFSQTDYNFETPSTDLATTADSRVDLPSSDKYELYDYPGQYETVAEGQVLTRIRMEAEEAPYEVVSGASTAPAFSPGARFALGGHPQADEDGIYLLTSVAHSIARDGGESPDPGGDVLSYENHFTCIPDSVLFRPPRTTPKPLVHGPQTAVVVGPAGEEIHTDEFGRVKVQFHWDREGQKDENSSCWIRVAQDWAGAGRNALLYLPAIGQEVVVDFLNGDPDRPIITGRVYNAEDLPPRRFWRRGER